jgi:hypothetical protein
MLISALLYSASLIVLLLIVFSYILAYKMHRSMSVLSLIMFFLATMFVVFVAVIDLWSRVYYFEPFKPRFTELRGAIFLGACLFLLYTTWRKNK